MMTPSQLTTLKAAIVADSTANAFPNNSDGNFGCAAYLNSIPAVPTQLWRADLRNSEVVAALVGADVAALATAGLLGLLQLLVVPDLIDASSANIRIDFSTLFASKQSLTNLTAIAQRPGTRFEVIFSSGGPPAVSSMFGQQVSYQDVGAARSS